MRVLALVEAETVNGPVKNLLSFYRSCLEMETPCGVQLSLAAFERLRGEPSEGTKRSNEFLERQRRPASRLTAFRKVSPSICA